MPKYYILIKDDSEDIRERICKGTIIKIDYYSELWNEYHCVFLNNNYAFDCSNSYFEEYCKPLEHTEILELLYE